MLAVRVTHGRPGIGKATGDVSPWTRMAQFCEISLGFITISLTLVECISGYQYHNWGWLRDIGIYPMFVGNMGMWGKSF